MILGARVRVAGTSPEVLAAVEATGRRVVRDRYGPHIAFQEGPSGQLPDDLVELLQLLVRLGVGFERDYKQTFPPAGIVSELIDQGVEFDHPWACSYDGTDWIIQPHPWSSF